MEADILYRTVPQKYQSEVDAASHESAFFRGLAYIASRSHVI